MKNNSRNNNKPESISIIGLGKLGLSYLAAFASRGFKVIGVDVNPSVIELVSKGKAPIYEPGLEDMLQKYKKNIQVTSDYSLAIEKTDVSFILVATPSDSWGRFSNNCIESALKFLAEGVVKSQKQNHLFVIGSTLMPGSIQYRLIPLIEKHLEKTLNDNFGVAFVPDFVALGSVIHDFLNPDLVLIGESCPSAGESVEKILKKLTLNNPPFVRTSLIEAETAKVALNCYITMKISFANSLANLCEKIPGANVDNITKAIGFDKRISPHYLKGGPSFGGTCFPRDVKAYTALAKRLGVQAELIEATEKVNNFQKSHLLDLVMGNLFETDRTVSILGTAFKQNTPVVEESISNYLIPRLIDQKVKVTVYDKLALEQTRKVFGDEINYASSMEECLTASIVTVVANSDPEFKTLDFGKSRPGSTIIDCWRILNASTLLEKVNYIPLGVYSLF